MVAAFHVLRGPYTQYGYCLFCFRSHPCFALLRVMCAQVLLVQQNKNILSESSPEEIALIE